MKHGVIAFCGSKGSGKSTSATIFRGQFSEPTEELAFAGHLKTTCAKVFNMDMDLFLNPDKKEVELDEYPVLTRDKILAIFKEFQIDTYDFDKHVRQHMGQIFETPRRLLQYVGTDLLHPIDSLIHVNITLKLKDPNKLSIITDLRFPQEFDALAARPDFVPVYVFNQGAEDRAKADGHASEKAVLTFKNKCRVLPNNDSLDKLATGITNLIKVEYGE